MQLKNRKVYVTYGMLLAAANIPRAEWAITHKPDAKSQAMYDGANAYNLWFMQHASLVVTGRELSAEIRELFELPAASPAAKQKPVLIFGECVEMGNCYMLYRNGRPHSIVGSESTAQAVVDGYAERGYFSDWTAMKVYIPGVGF